MTAHLSHFEAREERERWRLNGPYVGAVLALATLYVLAAIAGNVLKFTGNVDAVWPPAGVAIGGLYLLGLRLWPAVLIGDILADLLPMHTLPLISNIGQTAGNMLEAVIPAMLLAWYLGRRSPFNRLEDLALFAAIILARHGDQRDRRRDLVARGRRDQRPRLSAGLAHLVARRFVRRASARPAGDRLAATRADGRPAPQPIRAHRLRRHPCRLELPRARRDASADLPRLPGDRLGDRAVRRARRNTRSARRGRHVDLGDRQDTRRLRAPLDHHGDRRHPALHRRRDRHGPNADRDDDGAPRPSRGHSPSRAPG